MREGGCEPERGNCWVAGPVNQSHSAIRNRPSAPLTNQALQRTNTHSRVRRHPVYRSPSAIRIPQSPSEAEGSPDWSRACRRRRRWSDNHAASRPSGQSERVRRTCLWSYGKRGPYPVYHSPHRLDDDELTSVYGKPGQVHSNELLASYPQPRCHAETRTRCTPTNSSASPGGPSRSRQSDGVRRPNVHAKRTKVLAAWLPGA
jgi:hypothetical protein